MMMVVRPEECLSKRMDDPESLDPPGMASRPSTLQGRLEGGGQDLVERQSHPTEQAHWNTLPGRPVNT